MTGLDGFEPYHGRAAARPDVATITAYGQLILPACALTFDRVELLYDRVTQTLAVRAATDLTINPMRVRPASSATNYVSLAGFARWAGLTFSEARRYRFCTQRDVIFIDLRTPLSDSEAA